MLAPVPQPWLALARLCIHALPFQRSMTLIPSGWQTPIKFAGMELHASVTNMYSGCRVPQQEHTN